MRPLLLRHLALALAAGTLPIACDDSPAQDPTEDLSVTDSGRTDSGQDGDLADGAPPPDSGPPPTPDGAPPLDEGVPLDQGPTPDAEPGADQGLDATPLDAALDGAAPDADLVDAELPLDLALPDAELPLDAAIVAPDQGPPCIAPDPVLSPAPGALARVPLREALVVGGPPDTGATTAADIEGDGLLDLVVTRGGRLEAVRADGRPRWKTAVTGVTRVGGVVDLDGDARLEVVAIGPRTVRVHDALTGDLRWQLPDDPLGDAGPDFVSVTMVLLRDVDRDGRVDLYITDGSCTFDGPGNGILYRFLNTLADPTGLPILGPRTNGRCTTSQTIVDVDGDGTDDLLLNDARGLNQFDLRTGQRVRCGDIPGINDGVLPHLSADLLPDVPGLELVVLRQAALRLVAEDPVPRADCPDAPALRTRWQADGAWLPDAVAVMDVDGDGRDEVIGSRREAGVWRTEALSADTGAVIAAAEGWALRGAIDLADGPALLLTDNPDRFGAVQLARLTPAGLAPLWGAPLEDAAIAVRAPAPTEARLNLGLSRPQILRADGQPRFVVVRDTDGDALIDTVHLAHAGGPGPMLPLDGAPGALVVTCDPLACDTRDLLVVGEPGGTLQTFEADWTPRHPLADAPALTTGQVQVVLAEGNGPTLVVRTASHRVGAVDLSRPEAPLAWSLAVGPSFQGSGGPPIVLPTEDGPDHLLVAASRFGLNTWLALDAATGEVRWQSDLPDLPARAAEAVGALTPDGARFVRLDVVADARRFEGVPGCPAPTIIGDVLSPDPTCPARPLNPRVLSAFDATTGACLWQTHLQPVANCAGRANQRVSAADADADGWPELYVTEGIALHQLDLATGALLNTVDLRNDTGPASGGGVVIATGDAAHPLVLVGGNGPLEARAADVTLQWAATLPANLDGRSWLGREALVVGDEVWAVPGRGWPLTRYALDSADPAAPVGRLGLRNGVGLPDALGEDAYADITALRRLPGIGMDGGPGLVATADDGWLYGLRDDGTLAWARELPALGEPPVTGDVDQDGQLELLVPLSDGRLLVGESQALISPPQVLDRPCDGAALCAPDDRLDLNVLPTTDTLCAAWVAVAEADGYEARVTTENGTPRSAWVDTDTPAVRISPLSLVPGARYRVEVRAWRAGDAGRLYAETISSDGVRITDAVPPEVSLALQPAAAPTGTPVTIQVAAADDDLIASRRVEVLDANGALQWVANIEQAVVPTWEAEYVWDGLTLDGDVAPAGDYVVRATAGDRAANRVTAEAALRRCDGACP